MTSPEPPSNMLVAAKLAAKIRAALKETRGVAGGAIRVQSVLVIPMFGEIKVLLSFGIEMLMVCH